MNYTELISEILAGLSDNIDLTYLPNLLNEYDGDVMTYDELIDDSPEAYLCYVNLVNEVLERLEVHNLPKYDDNTYPDDVYDEIDDQIELFIIRQREYMML